DVMAPTFSVKARLLTGMLLVLSALARGEDAPDPAAILKSVRLAQSSQEQALNGRLRTGGQEIPFKLTTKDGTIRWEFSNPSQTLLLRLGASGATLEESGKGGLQKIGPARYDDKVRGSD